MKTYYQDDAITLHHGDALEVAQRLATASVDCIVTSPPYYGLRDYGSEGQYGLEESPAEYVETMRDLFSELRRTLADDGTLWLNVGDSYNSAPVGRFNGGTGDMFKGRSLAGHASSGAFDKLAASGLPPKNLLGMPWMVALALQQDGWLLRNEIIWHKTATMPERAQDRLARKHENVFLFAKNPRYFFNLPKNENDANAGTVWTLAPEPFPAAHFAVMPIQLAQRCIVAGCKPGGTVLDPFNGSGTTGLAAQRTGRKYVGIDLNADYLDLSLRTRLCQQTLDLDGSACG